MPFAQSEIAGIAFADLLVRKHLWFSASIKTQMPLTQ
jgi:hypothetical protein